ncbi:putative integral membrane protein [Brugia pahangi]
MFHFYEFGISILQISILIYLKHLKVLDLRAFLSADYIDFLFYIMQRIKKASCVYNFVSVVFIGSVLCYDSDFFIVLF